jgi:hypothetical protein
VLIPAKASFDLGQSSHGLELILTKIYPKGHSPEGNGGTHQERKKRPQNKKTFPNNESYIKTGKPVSGSQKFQVKLTTNKPELPLTFS